MRITPKMTAAIFLIGINLLNSGCATLIHGSSQNVDISSSPSGAEALINPGNLKIVTPGTVTLERKHSYYITFEKEGFEEGSATLTNSSSGLIWANFFLGGIFGIVVDLISGGGYNLKPENVFVKLQSKPIPSSISPSQVSPSQEQPKETTKPLDNLQNELLQLEKMKSDGQITNDEYLKLKEKIIDKY